MASVPHHAHSQSDPRGVSLVSGGGVWGTPGAVIKRSMTGEVRLIDQKVTDVKHAPISIQRPQQVRQPSSRNQYPRGGSQNPRAQPIRDTNPIGVRRKLPSQDASSVGIRGTDGRNRERKELERCREKSIRSSEGRREKEVDRHEVAAAQPGRLRDGERERRRPAR